MASRLLPWLSWAEWHETRQLLLASGPLEPCSAAGPSSNEDRLHLHWQLGIAQVSSAPLPRATVHAVELLHTLMQAPGTTCQI